MQMLSDLEVGGKNRSVNYIIKNMLLIVFAGRDWPCLCLAAHVTH